VLILHTILAAAAVGALALKPKGSMALVAILVAATLDIALGAPVLPALETVAPLLSFLAAALTLAALLERAGLAQRAAHALAVAARGHALTLYALVCALCALLTAVVSLDGAVVLMVPLLLALARDYRAPFAPLFLGVITVANAASVAVPQGNPTNLVLMGQLGLSPAAFLAHMLAPGLGAAVICAGAVALRERRMLATTYAAPPLSWTPLSGPERHAALTLVAAALAAWLAPLLGLAPWWPFIAVVAVSLLLRRERPNLSIPWRIAVQVAGLLVATQALALHAPAEPTHKLAGLLAIAIGIGAASALANNLPVSASATALLAAGPTAYVASIGLAVGALAAPQGSVATLIAADLAGPNAPPLQLRRLAPLAGAAVLVATLVFWATLRV
jgi:Na+/H+ antiporter NhaD/arsenite permease-like protein